MNIEKTTRPMEQLLNEMAKKHVEEFMPISNMTGALKASIAEASYQLGMLKMYDLIKEGKVIIT